MPEHKASGQSLTALLANGQIRYGDPISFSGLALIPLFSSRRAPVDYILLADAVRAGTTVIEEVGPGSVPMLRVVNGSERPVLIVEAEHVIGLKQNRALNATILVPAKASLDVAVSCVEAHRWDSSLGAAQPISPHVFARVRAHAVEAVTTSVRKTGMFRVDQKATWADLDTALGLLGARSPSMAMDVAYTQRASDFDHYVQNLPWQLGQTGVIAAVDGKIVCADLFDRPETLRDLWGRLVPSYAVEAILKPQGPTLTAKDAEEFLLGALDAAVTEHPTVGLGASLRLSSDLLAGSALEFEGAILHLAIFRRVKRPS